MSSPLVHAEGQRPQPAGALRNLDPRLSLLATILYIVVVSSLPHGAWTMYAVAAAVIVVIIVLGKLPGPRLALRSLAVLPVAAVAAVSVLFTREGTEVLSLPVFGGHLTATREGGLAALSLVSKSYLSVLASSVLITSIGFARAIDAMRALRMPGVLTQTIAFAYRYLHVLGDEGRRMLTARESRSAGSGRSVWWRARVLGSMIGTLFLRSLSRSERIYFAMLARGFYGETVSLSTISWTRRDTIAAFLWVLVLVSIIVCSWIIYG